MIERWLTAALLCFLATTTLQAQEEQNSPTAQAAIGWKLFFDPALSRNSNISCASCHDPQLGYGDGKRFSTGTHGDVLTRNTPSVVNLAGATHLFWDGRANSLEAQALGPLTNPLEMDLTPAEIEQRVAADDTYRQAFSQIGVEQIGIADITAALATFERGLKTGPSAYDRWLQGNADALDKSQSNGRFLFFTRGQCATCHIGDAFTDHKFHNIGTGTQDDLGRATITGAASDRGNFKTPSLRNWRGKEPFMHDGRFATIVEVIDFYTNPPPPDIGESELDPLRFNARDKADLLAFMDALNGDWPNLAPYEERWQALLTH